MWKVGIFLLFVFIPSPAMGDVFSLGIPFKSFDGDRIWIFEWSPKDLKDCDPHCVYWGLQLAHADLHEARDVNFLGVYYYFELRGGDAWSRVGFGWGLFDRKSEKIRSGWDFGLSVEHGYDWGGGWSNFLALKHWSNGLSFAEKIGIEDYWPENNDGGNSFVFGLRFTCSWGVGKKRAFLCS